MGQLATLTQARVVHFIGRCILYTVGRTAGYSSTGYGGSFHRYGIFCIHLAEHLATLAQDRVVHSICRHILYTVGRTSGYSSTG